MNKDSFKEILMNILIFAFCIFGFVIPSVAAPGIINTVAGTGKQGFSGDGGKATEAKLDTPTGVFVDSEGNLFIADKRSYLIRRVDGQGIITTVAGTGERGFSDDGGKATQAELNNPIDVFVDSEGNLFIADWGNFCIRRVDGQTGIITTVAGTREAGFSGDGGKAAQARLNWPSGILVDSEGNLFILDRRNNCIRRVDAQTGIITTVVGTGERGFFGDGGKATEARLNWSSGFFMDSEGNLFIADEYNHRIRRVDGRTDIITTVAGTGERGFSGDGEKAIQAMLDSPTSVFVDSEGNLFIADSSNLRIRRVDGQTGIITTVAGTGEADFSGDGGKAIEATFNWPTGVFVDSEGNLFIADLYNHCIRRVEKIAAPTTLTVGVFTPISDTTPPAMIFSSPRDGDKNIDPNAVNADGIVIKFSEPIDTVEMQIYLKAGDQMLRWQLIWADNDTKLTLMPTADNELNFGTEYTVTLSQVVDKAGNGAREIVIAFTTKSATTWDVDGNGVVDIVDLTLVGTALGTSGEKLPADVNGDGVVDISDLAIVGIHFGEVTNKEGE